MAQIFDLVISTTGTATLTNEDGDLVWSSDDDDKFSEEFEDEFLTEEDISDVEDYLFDENYIPEGDAVTSRMEGFEEDDEDDELSLIEDEEDDDDI